MATIFGIIMIFSAFMGCYSEKFRRDRYGRMITAVHNRYDSSGIIFSTSSNELQSFDLQEILHGVSRDSSNHQIFITRVDYGQLEERIEFYRHRIGRPMVIIIIRTEREILEFKESTEKIAMGFPVWMMIFSDADKDNRVCEFCHNPTTNPFRLENSTEFLVTCCSNRKLEEWWSKDGKTANVLPVGELINEKMQWVQTESEFHRRRETVQLQLRVVALNDSSLLIKNGTYSGFLGDVLTSLMNLMNFSIAPPILVDSGGIWNETESEWTGAMKVMAREEADIGSVLVMMTNRRLDVVDFTVPLFIVRTRLFIKKPGSDGIVHWSSYLQTFEKKVWLTIMVILFASSTLLILIKYNPQRNTLWSVVSDSVLEVFEFPTQSSLSITYYSIFLTALIMLAAYSGAITSILTAPTTNLPFNDFEEFSKQIDYKLIVIKNDVQHDFLAESENPLEKDMFKLLLPEELLPTNIREMISQLCEKKVAFYGTMVHFPMDIELPCEIVTIGIHTVEKYGMILPRNSPYTTNINSYIIGFHNNGLLKFSKRKYYTIDRISSKTTHKAAEFLQIVPIVAVLCGGIFFSLLMLLLEY